MGKLRYSSKDLLKTSTDLQSDLIKMLVNLKPEKLKDKSEIDLIKDFLIKITESIQTTLIIGNPAMRNTGTQYVGSCAIFYIDGTFENGDKRATMIAASSYSASGTDKIIYRIKDPNLYEIPEIPKKKEEKLGITGVTISTGRAFLSTSLDEIKEHPHHTLQNAGRPEDRNLSAYLIVPMRDPLGVIIGGLKAERLEGYEAFSVAEQIMLETYAELTGRCIAHLIDFKNGKYDTAITAWVLDVIQEAIAGGGELDEFLDIVVNVTAAATTADSCSVFLKDYKRPENELGGQDNQDNSIFGNIYENNIVTQRAGCGSQELKRIIRSYKLPTEDKIKEYAEAEIVPLEEKFGLTAWIASTGRSFIANNSDELKKHPHHRGEYDPINYNSFEKCGALFGVPLRIGGIIIGVMKIENVTTLPDDKRKFDNQIQDRLVSLAQNIALSIEKIQTQRPLKYKVLTDAMPTIFEILRGNLDVEGLVEKVVRDTALLFNAKACALFLKEGNQLIQPSWAAYGWATRGPKVRTYNLVDKMQIIENPTERQKVGLTVWIAVMRKPFSAKSNLELHLHPHHKGTFDSDNFNQGEDCQSFMGVPLVVGAELIGVMKVETKTILRAGTEGDYTYFNEQDELVFRLMATSTAIAIQNARLLESNRLSDKINGYDDYSEIIIHLYNFVEKRVEAVDVLEKTARNIKNQNEIKAKIVEAFKNCLTPQINENDFNILEKHAQRNLKTLFNSLSLYSSVKSISDFANLKRIELDKSENSQVWIYHTFDFLSRIQSEIINPIVKSDPDKSSANILQNIHSKLSELKDAIKEKNIFEKNVMYFILNRLEITIDSYLTEKIELTLCTITNMDFFHNLNWEFQPNINILLGKNGYGKSLLLRLILAAVQNEKEIVISQISRSKNNGSFNIKVSRDQKELTAEYCIDNTATQLEKIPVLAIPASRFINRSKEIIRPDDDSEVKGGLKESGAYHFLHQKPFEYIIQRFLYQLCLDYFENNKSFDHPKFNLIKGIVNKLTDGEFAFAKIQQVGNALVTIDVYTEGNAKNPLPIQRASQGTLSVLAIFGLIYEYLKSMYPNIGYDDLLQKPGIVFIDEIDAHLHPSWQQKIISLLRETFPQVQFVLTAHSPLVVAGCREHEVAVLRKAKSDNSRKGKYNGFTIEQFPQDFIGFETADLYKEIFEIEEKDESYLYYTSLYQFKDVIEKDIKDIKKDPNLQSSPDAQQKLEKLYTDLKYALRAQRMLEKRVNVEILESENRTLKAKIKSLDKSMES